MKKLILVTITSILIFTCFLTTKKAHADITDIFLNNEIYLFNNINEINFNEGYYIDKTTISEEDKNNDSNNFMWYFNLGHRLVAENFPEDSGGYKCLAIPLNNMVAKYVAFAFGFSRGPDLAIEVRYSDNSVVQYATSDYTDTTKVIYTPNEQNLTKNILYIAWEIYDPDYYISFLPLTSEGYYNMGYNEGLSDGFDNGMETGYNRGYYDGFLNGSTQSDQVIYDKVLLYNQQVVLTDRQTTLNNVVFTITANDGKVNVNGIADGVTRLRISTIYIKANHIYYVSGCPSSSNSTDNNYYLYDNWYGRQIYYGGYRGTFSSDDRDLGFFVVVNDNINANNIDFYPIFIDLTLMYGSGYEPSLSECQQIFSLNYYPPSEETPVDMGYFTGYYNGKSEGINEGINIGETNQINMGWIQEIFRAIQTFLNIKIFPRVTVGVLVMIPFILTFTGFIIGVIRKGGDKGGGDDD